ncbi:MAG: hypothetical protein HYU98_07250 [Deltaproteobacteria bacterium]|nr:hypothetical protein [Deltaproteobacteria bacterium]
MKRSKIEIFAVVAVVILAVGIFGVKSFLINKAEKENALMAELKSLRTSVQIYLVLNKSYPSDLKSLAGQKFVLGSKEESYIKGIKFDREGYPIDVFGQKFDYNPGTGWVSSSVKRYSEW